MRYVLQAICVVAIAIGGGLFAYGSYLEPRLDPENPVEAVHAFHVDKDTHEIASVARGVGVGFIALGGFGLIVPWANIVLRQRIEERELTATNYPK